jgi:BirA family biotin operon repressor/biotin-[acetyl-CoA-carboxylase] ligase
MKKEVSLVRGEEVRHGTALDIDDEGALIVRLSDGSIETVNSGEVSVRGMYGYV